MRVPPATVRTNQELVNEFTRTVWNGERLEAITALTTNDVVVHGLGAGVDREREKFVTFHTGLLKAVPNLTHTIQSLVTDGTEVLAHVTIEGTPERQFGALVATGTSFVADGFHRYRIEDGRIAEVWTLPNAMGMLRQLGVFPDTPGKMVKLMFGAVKGRLFGV